MIWRAALIVALSYVVALGCSADIPEAETPAARLYANRCNGCHKLHAPASLTAAMWEMQMDRMQREIVRRGMPPLTKEESDTLLAYLRRHSAGAQATQ